MKITPVLPPSASDFESLKLGLTRYNESFTGPVLTETVAAFAKNEAGDVVGGILGEISWDWMHISGLWVDETIRNSGWGARLLEHLEQHALSKGVSSVRLETTTFQALEFYLKSGYSVFGELPNMPMGHTSYFLQKQARL